jgi:hypothetical protein
VLRDIKVWLFHRDNLSPYIYTPNNKRTGGIKMALGLPPPTSDTDTRPAYDVTGVKKLGSDWKGL